MNKTKGLFSVLSSGFVVGVLILVFSGPGMAGDLEPPGPPASTMKTLDEVEPRIPISNLPFTIDQPGSYYLTADLSVTGSAVGITVNADDVTIDLMGYTIRGGGSSYGILMYGNQNVEIKNGTIEGFNYAIIEMNSGSGHRIIRVRALDNGHSGIALTGTGNLIAGCTVADNGVTGIQAEQGSTLINNTAYDNGNGIDADQSTLINNAAYSNNQSGILAYSSTARNNVATQNGRHGIYISNGLADGNTAISNNTIGGSYANITCVSCTLGTNHAP